MLLIKVKMDSKIFILFGIMVVILGLSTVSAGPVILNGNLEDGNHSLKESLHELHNSEESLPGPRQRRVTCDLLSASIKGNSLNHSACAANCLIQGFKGGYCNKGVCHCRR